MRHTINEWQDMGLKKDVENITKELQKNKSYEKPLILELYIAVITLIIDKIFDLANGCELVQKIVLYCLLSIATGIFIYAVFTYIKDYFATRSKIKSSIYNIKPYIDSFDNNICYYAMTASNFYENILGTNATTNASTSQSVPTLNTDKEQFYYIETHYYINKCISELSKMDNIFKDVFTDEAEDVIYNSKIHFSRLKNIIDLLVNIRKNLYQYSSTVCNKEADEISGKYDAVMKEFVDRINGANKFSTKLEWTPKEHNTSP